MVQVTQSAEHASGSSASESNNDSLFLGIFDIEHLDHWTISGNGKLDDFLVDLFGVGGRLSEETPVTNVLEASLVWRWV